MSRAIFLNGARVHRFLSLQTRQSRVRHNNFLARHHGRFPRFSKAYRSDRYRVALSVVSKVERERTCHQFARILPTPEYAA